ncbi:unnamed protein product [Rangifer tarandus platyrhynchus]|uniref:Uncharacterized protein n=1 Tax=Rangifer tarandus platyrhynchus TaxID=3082113 RepID=A0AC59Z3N0_RANTA
MEEPERARAECEQVQETAPNRSKSKGAIQAEGIECRTVQSAIVPEDYSWTQRSHMMKAGCETSLMTAAKSALRADGWLFHRIS